MADRDAKKIGADSRKTKPLPFFAYDAAKNPLFSVNANVPFEDVLNNADCFMVSVEEAMLNIAAETDSPKAWGAYYMAQMVRGMIESMTASLLREVSHG